MKKANYVCSDAAFDVLDMCATTGNVSKAKVFSTMADNVGGGGKLFDGTCVLSTAVRRPGTFGEGPQKIKTLKADETWQKLDFDSEQYTPDFYLKSMSKQSATSCIIGEVKSDKLTARDEQEIWNQSIIGLKDRKETHAVYISPQEAGILTIKLEGDSIKTYKREYHLEAEDGDSLLVVDPNQMEKFFSDLVLTIWKSAYNEPSCYKY